MKKSTSWRKFRHRVTVAILRWPLTLYTILRYRIRVDRFKEQGNRPYLVVMNHQTGWDQFFVYMAFRGPLYIVASEDIFSLGWISDVIRYLVAPIPIKKQTTDLQAVKNCIKIAREGGTVCLAPEGHRTFHGKTVYMKPGIASLTKKLGLPLAIFRIEGGYGVQPRWSDVVRRGKMHAYISRVVEPEEYKAMTDAELMALIEKELWVDEAQVTGEFHHKKNAEFLERVVYVCPECGLSTFESHDDVIRCTKCGLSVRHKPTKELEGIEKPFPHRFVSDWYEWQNDYVNHLDTTAMTESPLWTETARFSRVHASKRKELLIKEAAIQLYGDRIRVDGRDFPFATTAVTLLGKNKLNLYADKDIYQIKGSKRFNALKYLNFYHRYNNLTTGEHHDQFLGL